MFSEAKINIFLLMYFFDVAFPLTFYENQFFGTTHLKCSNEEASKVALKWRFDI